MWRLYSCCSVWHTTHFGSFRECQSPMFLANFVSTLYPIFNDIHSNQDINVSRLWWSRSFRRTSPSRLVGLWTYTWVTDHKNPLYSVLRLTSEPFSESLSKPEVLRHREMGCAGCCHSLLGESVYSSWLVLFLFTCIMSGEPNRSIIIITHNLVRSRNRPAGEPQGAQISRRLCGSNRACVEEV